MQKFLPIKKSIFIVCLAMMLCWIPVTAHAAGHREAPTSPTRILFVGNSYTQRNHMPNIFRKLCKSSGQNVIVRSLTNPGHSLKNTSNPTTANGRKLYRLLRMQRWDYVILQDRRYYPISKPQRMKRTIRKLAPYIQASGAKMVLYQTWAPGNGIMIMTGTIPCQTALITRVFLTVRLRRSPKSTMLLSLRLAQHFCSAAILRMGSNF